MLRLHLQSFTEIPQHNMLKNILFFKIGASWNQDLADALRALEPARFIECTPTQEKSVGLVEPRGEKNGPLIESIGGQWILKLMTQSKVLPGAVVKEEVAERIAKIEEERGRKPGKKEKAEITENARHELLTQAFTKKSAAVIWIDPKARLLIVEASSQNKADETITTLVKVFTDFAVSPVNTVQTPGAAMAAWLNTQEMPSGLPLTGIAS
jgi:recombination associated protein RdgC